MECSLAFVLVLVWPMLMFVIFMLSFLQPLCKVKGKMRKVAISREITAARGIVGIWEVEKDIFGETDKAREGFGMGKEGFINLGVKKVGLGLTKCEGRVQVSKQTIAIL